MLRLCLDINVWVSRYLAIARGREHTAACDLADAVFAGACRLGPVQLVVSHAMLDTLEMVLRRIPVTASFADRARDQVEAAAGSLCLPLGILGGTGANPLLDQEDAAVLGTAMAGRADLLVTSNKRDLLDIKICGGAKIITVYEFLALNRRQP